MISCFPNEVIHCSLVSPSFQYFIRFIIISDVRRTYIYFSQNCIRHQRLRQSRNLKLCQRRCKRKFTQKTAQDAFCETTSTPTHLNFDVTQESRANGPLALGKTLASTVTYQKKTLQLKFLGQALLRFIYIEQK